MGSVGQRAAKLLAIKLWEWFDPGTTRIRADRFDQGRGRVADFFMRPPTLTASNFAALWPTDLKFLAFKDLNPFSKCVKFQEATSILRLGFALSKWPHFDSGYLLGRPFGLHLIVLGQSKDYLLRLLFIGFRFQIYSIHYQEIIRVISTLVQKFQEFISV